MKYAMSWRGRGASPGTMSSWWGTLPARIRTHLNRNPNSGSSSSGSSTNCDQSANNSNRSGKSSGKKSGCDRWSDRVSGSGGGGGSGCCCCHCCSNRRQHIDLGRFVTVLTALLIVFATIMTPGHARRMGSDGLALWIDKRQVREFNSLLQMDIFVISDGQVEALIQEPNFDRYLPAIPDRVNRVNLTWRGGEKRSYVYEFQRLSSSNQDILEAPRLSIPTRGRVPRKTRVFQIALACVGNVSGSATLNVEFSVRPEGGDPLRGMPVRFRLQKRCPGNVPDPQCQERCGNGGRCDMGNVCHCSLQYMGQYCETPVCHPPCLHGGVCVAPDECDCPAGYQGPQCEGGICVERCLNGGKCIQKDVCQCGRGYYGPRCEFSKCSIPCLNGGRCDGVNRCICRRHFRGNQCEMEIPGSRKRNNQRKRKPEIFV